MSSSPYIFSDSETINDTNSTINSNFTYCKICESNFANTNKRAYGYSRKESWNLKSTAFTVATDNRMNMVKAVRLLKENYLGQIQHQSCVAHTLQLSAERLHSPQQQNFQINLFENEYVNPLEVLTNVKTRWNSTYLA
ncbi:unnamed protein product [Rhizophagus irregularis]|nr:unnamed protein product [Rhizophagus irregularis]CAB5376454.1 unnamed protein product [Rhizophagus irregularis]